MAGRAKQFDMGGYVEVKDRIIPFHEKYPDGRIETEVIEITDTRVTVKALLFDSRLPEALPIATGHSWMNVPGSTTFTKGSEIENTETSAVGRALAFIGIGIDKSIASKDEVYGKAGDETEPPVIEVDPNAATAAQKKELRQAAEAIYGKVEWKKELEINYGVVDSISLTKDQADAIIKELKDEVPF